MPEIAYMATASHQVAAGMCSNRHSSRVPVILIICRKIINSVTTQLIFILFFTSEILVISIQLIRA